MSRIRVLVVDDSAFARKVVREVLEASPAIEVVGIARDGLDALEKIAELHPDVVTLDLVMPNLDGLGVLEAYREASAPRFVIVSATSEDSDLAIAALNAGAIEIVEKPTALATDRLYELSTELVAKVVIAATAGRPAQSSQVGASRASAVAESRTSTNARRRIVLIGASTGGPQALTKIFSEISGDFPAPIAVALHMPPGYTESLAKRLDGLCALHVVEAESGLALKPGLVAIARAGMHLKISRGDPLTAILDVAPLDKPHRPSVDVLFESASRAVGADVLAAVLTGMGEDGLEGARAVRAAGGMIVTETESSCVVYGMPRAVHAAGLSDVQVPLDSMVATLERFV